VIQSRHRADDGFTGLELIICIIVLIGIAALLMFSLGGSDVPGWARTFPGGVVAESTYISGDHLQPVGSVYGFSPVHTRIGTTRIVTMNHDPNRLVIVRLVVSLFMGDTGAIDMDKVQVQWNHAGSAEYITRTPGTTLICPNWTISNKFNLLPGRTADSDDWLEPDEQFEITLCPSESVPPYGFFALTLSPDGVAMPLTLTRTAPPAIQPVMNLG
jgi:hypothetical protein